MATTRVRREADARQGQGIPSAVRRVMNICPVLIDSQPDYLIGQDRAASLLLVPLGTGRLIDHLLSRLQAGLTAQRPLVLAPPGADVNYRHRLHEICPGVDAASGWPELTDALGKHEPSDLILMIDPRCFPTDGFDFDALRPHASADPRWAVHLVAFERGVGIQEFVHFDSTGCVRRIQRYYDSITWPFITGVAASLLPLSSGIVGDGFAPASLWELRSLLTGSGIPSRDLDMIGGAHDLNDESGLLAASEQFIVQATSGRGRSQSAVVPLLVGAGHDIHPTARMIGAVVLHENVTIEKNARVVGPTLIGAGAHIGEGAVVAQAVVGPGCVIPPSGLVRHSAMFRYVGPVEGAPVVHSPRWGALSERSALDFEAPETDRPAYLAIKRTLDAVIAAIGLAILSPLLMVVAILIRLGSRGTIFYGHEREGRDGRVFRCWKFRTMYQGAEARQRELHAVNLMDGPQFKMVRDPRITRIGRILRATNIDEVPQLFNVLLGEMSLVGPRPSPFRENQYCVPWRQARLSVRPGITGLWQVCRHDREISDFHQWIEYDVLYVRHASLLLDLKIFAATIFTLGGKLSVGLSWIVPNASPNEIAEPPDPNPRYHSSSNPERRKQQVAKGTLAPRGSG